MLYGNSIIKHNNLSLTTALRDVDIDTQFRQAAPREVRNAAVGGLISELHVHDFQAAGTGRHVRVAAQHDERVGGEDGSSVLVPGVVHLILWLRVNVAGKFEVSTHLYALAVFVGVWCDLEC